MAEVQGEFKDLYFKKNTENSEIEAKSCKIIRIDNNVKAYLLTDNRIWVYYDSNTEKGNNDNPIEQDTQLVKLKIKNDGRSNNPYMYIDFINTHVEGQKDQFPKLPEIIGIIKNITKEVDKKITKIMLQDDAHFYCNNEMKYAVKALYLRALDNSKQIGQLSIYETRKFTPTKTANLQGCITALRNIMCSQLKESCIEIIKQIESINYSTTSVYQIHVQHTDLQISYTPIKSHKLRLQPIFSSYKSNLNQLISLLNKDNLVISIYDFCKVDKQQQKQEKCELRKNILSCLENDVNMNVIIVEGESRENKDEYTQCEVNIVERADKQVINITKLFNLFYGTFKKLNYLYNEMELTLEE